MEKVKGKETENKNEDDKNGELLYEKFIKGSKIYGFSLRKTRQGNFYIVFTEKEVSKEKNIQFNYHRIRVYEESLDLFITRLQTLADIVKKEIQKRN